ncbi:UNVERIFIED_CONTAM: AcrR family transcriptional regulator [Streptomyces canus]
MRGLPARCFASCALCAALLVAVAGPTAAASRGPVPVPHADALRPQVEALAELGGVLTPVTDLLTTVLKADNGQISAEQAAKLGDAVKDATAKITEEASAAAVIPPATDATATPSTTTGSTTPTPSLLLTLIQNGYDDEARSIKAPADLLDDAIDALEKAIDALLEAVTSGEATQVESTLPAVVSGLVDAVAATMIDTELPAPDLAGLSSLPSSSQLPVS